MLGAAVFHPVLTRRPLTVLDGWDSTPGTGKHFTHCHLVQTGSHSILSNGYRDKDGAA